MNPKVWGPPVWTTLHLVALGYPEAPDAPTRDAYRAFYAAVGPVLPCATCADHYAEHLAALPMDDALARGGRALFDWTVALHNRVNVQTGKRELTADEVLTDLAVGSGHRARARGMWPTPARAHELGLGVLIGAGAGAALVWWALMSARRRRG